MTLKTKITTKVDANARVGASHTTVSSVCSAPVHGLGGGIHVAAVAVGGSHVVMADDVGAVWTWVGLGAATQYKSIWRPATSSRFGPSLVE
jgi:hypothetical protein